MGGWSLSHVNGEEMPRSGQAAANAITKALSAGKQGGKAYSLKFLIPAGKGSPKAAFSNATMAAPKAAATLPKATGPSGKASMGAGAFGAFSSGLGGTGCGLEPSLLEAAHKTMLDMSAHMSAMGMASAC